MTYFEINTYGNLALVNKTKDFYNMVIGGPIFYLLLFSASKYTIDNHGYFIFTVIYLTALCIFIFILGPINIISTRNKVIKKIQINGTTIKFKANKEMSFIESDLEFKEVKQRFNGFGKREKDGILVKTNLGKEYWIIEEFYNEYEDLIKVLKLDSELK